METIKTWTDGAVTYRLQISPEDVPVRGNAMASGDADADRKVEDALLARLDDGDQWAWFYARVEASAFGFKGAAGGCFGGNSFDSEAQFQASDTLAVMVQAARASLDDAMLRARVSLAEAEAAGFWNE